MTCARDLCRVQRGQAVSHTAAGTSQWFHPPAAAVRGSEGRRYVLYYLAAHPAPPLEGVAGATDLGVGPARHINKPHPLHAHDVFPVSPPELSSSSSFHYRILFPSPVAYSQTRPASISPIRFKGSYSEIPNYAAMPPKKSETASKPKIAPSHASYQVRRASTILVCERSPY